MSKISQLLGVGIDKTLESVKSVVTTFVADKGVQQQINAEIDRRSHELKVRQMEHTEKIIEAEVKDRADARAMFRDTTKNEDVFVRRFPMFLAFGALAISSTLLVTMLFVSIPDVNRDIINISLGTLLGGSLGSVFSFFFGSTYNYKNRAD